MGKKIGFFGGTFDPIHLGHLNLVAQIKEQNQLDRILFSPARVSPAKENLAPLASAEDRLEMILLAIEGFDGFELCDKEIFGKVPSYTVDTILELVKDKKDYYLVMGEDIAYSLDQWKDIEKLLDLAPPLLGTRPGFDHKKFENLPPFIQLKLEEGRNTILSMEISSTEIRERFKKKLDCRHLLPRKVLDYIHQNRLYLSL